MKRSLAALLLVSFAATGAEAGWRGLPGPEAPAAGLETGSPAVEPAVITRLHLRSGVLTILAGPDQPLYSFAGNDGRHLEAQPLEGLMAFDPTLGDLITRSTASENGLPFMDASVPVTFFHGR